MLRNTESVTKIADVAGFKVITLTLCGRADETTNILQQAAFRSIIEMGNCGIQIITIAVWWLNSTSGTMHGISMLLCLNVITTYDVI
jgi:hypothetical protein